MWLTKPIETAAAILMKFSEFAKKILYMDQMFQFQFKNAFTQINNYV